MSLIQQEAQVAPKQTQKNVLWAVIIINALSSFIVGAFDIQIIEKLAPFIGVSTVTTFAFVHGVQKYGWKRMMVFFFLTFGISWFYETLSILVGFPFGNYYYSDLLGPKLWLVPIVIMPAYFSIAYVSWSIAHIFLDKINLVFNKRNVVTLPIIATFIMVMWDLSMDPARSTFLGQWVWEDGGAYFGVPFGNFMGWYLTVYCIFQAFAIYLKKQNKNYVTDKLEYRDRNHWILPVGMWLAVTIEFFMLPLFSPNQEISDLSGKTWFTSDIYESLALVTITTMIFVAIFALIKLYDSKKYE